MPAPSTPLVDLAARLSLGFTILALAVTGAPLRAQAEAKIGIPGRVLDATTGRPLFGAVVALGKDGPEVVTDSAGRFVLDVKPGSYALVISQLGYSDAWKILDVPPGAPPAALLVRLVPDPIVLQGITAIADRFRRRRNAVATSVRAYDRRQLLTSADRDAEQFLETHAFVHPIPCQGAAALAAFADCAYVRGRPTAIRVYIDDAPAIGGLDQLAMYDPSELYLLEVYGGGAQVRAYTSWWVEYSARHHIRPQPVLVW